MLNDRIGRASQRAPLHDVDSITEMAASDLLALRDARLFITGGTGYIGRWLLESLCHANRALDLQLTVTVLSRRPERFVHVYPHLAGDPCITLIKGDVRNFVCADVAFTHIIHAATDVVAETATLDLFDVTVNGTRHVLDFASRCKASHVLLLSSGAVYGTLPDHIIRAMEDMPCAIDVTTRRSAYGLGKIATEWLGNAYGQQHGFSCKSARIFAQIGPYLELGAHFAVGNFIRDVLLEQPIVINGDGTSERSYMYAVDLVTWLWAILVRGMTGVAYNVGAEQAVSIVGLAETIMNVARGAPVDIQILGQAILGAAPARYLPDTTRAREELGLSITVTLEDAIERTLNWHRSQLEKT